MYHHIKNLVFEGGGILAIAYLGVLNYLSQAGILQSLKRAAGTSSGAIAACFTSFNLPLAEMEKIVETLDFRKIPGKMEHPKLKTIPLHVRKEVEKYFGDINCLYRLMTGYGWYSSQYIYDWLRNQIAAQFDPTRKKPPYTFADFKNPFLHKDNRPFLDLYVIGTDITYKSSSVFSFETTPDMEVAEAVRISLSIPLFFEAVTVNSPGTDYNQPTVFSDGGIMRNYPINIFDELNYRENMMYGTESRTLGCRFKNHDHYSEVNNLLDFVKNLFISNLRVQQDIYDNSPGDIARSIQILTKGISPVDFNITPHDEIYHFLYGQGYDAAYHYFQAHYPQLF